MATTLNPGDRVLLRDRPWRVRSIVTGANDHRILEVEALDGDVPRMLSVVTPPEVPRPLPTLDVEFDRSGLESLNAWSNAHRILGATLIRETGLLTGARFGRVALEAYQLAPALRLLAKPRPSLLVADDVGLGKTVEAGLALLELLARGRADRTLVVTPPGLMDQWHDELLEKFGLDFTILDNAAGVARVQTSLPAGVNPWDALPRVITSLDFIKKETVRHRALRKRWDLVIVDEAHALAESGTPDNPYRTQRTRLGLELRKASRGLILLTATPHNGYSHSFRSLLELVEPVGATFNGSREDVQRRIDGARIRRMKAQIKRRLPAGNQESVFPVREVRGIPVAGLSAAEGELMRKVASYCSRTARQAEDTEAAELVGFAMQIVKKRALSSRAALEKTIEHRLSALKKEEEQEEPPDRAELRDFQADLPLGEAAAERTARRILKSAIPPDERRRNPECRRLIPQGGAECLACGSAARPAALCRTCGQDFVKVRFEAADGLGSVPVGTGDFYSDERTAFLTPRLHELAAAGEELDEDQEPETSRGAAKARRAASDVEAKLEPVSVCLSCGRVMEPEGTCPSCNRAGTPYFAYRWRKKQPPKAGILHVCPACGDTYTKGDIVTPLRTGTASTVATIAARHLDLLQGDDRKLLMFADNRQDVAHQAGYTSDRHRNFALRHVVAHEVGAAAERGVYLVELPQRLFDEYKRLGIIPARVTRPERERWLDALTYEVANEFTRHARQRASLENLGLVGVEYEFLDEVGQDPEFVAAAAEAGMDGPMAAAVIRAVLDVMRKNRAVGFDFFREYVDPNRKRRYRELEAEPYAVRFPDRDRNPKGFALERPDHIRKSKAGTILGFYQENPKAGQLTAAQKIVARILGGSRARAEVFLRAVVPVLLRLELLQAVPNFPLPKADRTASLRVLQVNPKVVRLVRPAAGYRCVACQTWVAYELPTCPTPKCAQGCLEPREVDQDNYYVRLYADRQPLRVVVAEHSAAISGDERAKRETGFKEGRVDALVCTPTLELGVDIGPLLTVVLRNAPPTPANYVQRVGRAGRRLRIGFVSTFCAGGAHDRHAFENPEWLLGGSFTPPRLRLDNPKVVHRHLRSYLLACVPIQLPRLMGELLDDVRAPTRCKLEQLEALFAAVGQDASKLATRLAGVFAEDREAGRTTGFGPDEARSLVDRFEREFRDIVDLWWRRVRQLDSEFRQYSTVGSPLHDMKKAAARQRAYREITQDPERAYALNYLATQGFLPAYQFPLDTFSLDPGVADTPTLFRPAAIAIEEFAPGNYVYANGHKLRSIRALFAGGPGRSGDRPTRSDAEASGRLRSFRFCDRCDEITEQPRNTCARCEAPLPPAVDCVFVDAFEAEESLRIGSDEESRQRQYHVRRESLLATDQSNVTLFAYPFTPVELHRLAPVVVTNWGRPDSKTGDARRFWLCPDCGRHLPQDPHDVEHAKAVQTWRENHARLCAGEPASLVLGYEFRSDCLVLSFPTREDARTEGRTTLSPTAVTLAEALLAGAGDLLELEPYELAAFPRSARPGDVADEVVFYETVPGGAGYVEEMARRLPEVARAAQQRLYGHQCLRGCYLCLKHYRNQRWHAFFDKDSIRDLLAAIAAMDPVGEAPTVAGAGARTLRAALEARQEELAPSAPGSRRTGPQSAIEAQLLEALRLIPGLPIPTMQYEVRDGERIITVPDFAYPDAKIAVFCDGFAFHGNQDTLELDARKRNWLQRNGWLVLTYWGRSIQQAPAVCAREIEAVYWQRTAGGGPVAW